MRTTLFIILILLFFTSCKEEISKQDNLGYRGMLTKSQIKKIQSNNWCVRKVFVNDGVTRHLVYTKDFRRIIEFKNSEIFENKIKLGEGNFKDNSIFLNGIDTISNKFYVNHVGTDRIILSNQVSYLKNEKLVKKYDVFVSLTLDTIKSNEEVYKIEF